MSHVNANIRFLRKQKGLTQEELAKGLNITRSVIGAYEEGRAEPKITTLQGFANFFGITLDQLIGSDLSELVEHSLKGTQPPSSKRGKGLQILSITVDKDDNENIELIPQKAAAGYLNGFADPEFLKELPRFSLPMFPQGTYRAFEISGDSMLPLVSGTIIIGEYVESWKDMKGDQAGIFITASDGIVFKRLKKSVNESVKLTLLSDNPSYQPIELDAEDILEVWKAKAFISVDFPDPEMSMDKLANIVLDLQKEVIKLKK